MKLLSAINVNETDVSSNNAIPLFINYAQSCSGMISTGNSIIVYRPGYFLVTITVTATAAAAGNIVLSLQKNGVDIPGITATETITTPDTEVRTLTLQGVFRVTCNEGKPLLTLINKSTIDITTTNVSVTIEG